jgi:transposase
MSLQPQAIPPVPDATATTARAAFPRGNRYLTMRDELGTLFTDQDFVDLYPVRGQPAYAPWRLALVLIFQFAEHLSDQQAADAVRGRIDWKYALSLDLTDAGFDPSVLSEFRDRLLAGGQEQRLLDTMLARFTTLGLLKARGRQRTDSTHVLAAVRALNRLQHVGETVRHALNVLAVAAPDWLRPQLHADWPDRYGTRFEEYRLPQAADTRQALAEQIGADGLRLLRAVGAADAPAWVRQLPAVQTLRRVWVEQYYASPDDTPPRWRTLEDQPPSTHRIHTPYDPDACYSVKRATTWTGYKVHVTETCDGDTPHLITHVLTTAAPGTDYHALAPIHAALAAKDLLPAEHLVDAGYIDADNLVHSQQDAINLLGRVATNMHWQMAAGAGYDIACFRLDWEARVATCPQGQTSRKWSATHDTRGTPMVNIRFDRAACAACPSRSQCTRSARGPRELSVRPQAHHEALQAARKRQQDDGFNEQVAARAGIEGTLSDGVRSSGLRRCRYLGLAKTRLQHLVTAAAINLRRFAEWTAETPRSQTRTAAFVKLLTAPGATAG